MFIFYYLQSTLSKFELHIVKVLENQNLDQNEYQYPLDSHSTSVDTENKQCIGESSIQDVVKEMSESQNLLTEIKKEVFQDDYKIKTEGKIK